MTPQKRRAAPSFESNDDRLAWLSDEILPQLLPRIAIQPIGDQRRELQWLTTNCHQIFQKSLLISLLVRYEPCVRDSWLRSMIATLAEHIQLNAAFSSSYVLSESDQKNLNQVVRLCRWSSDAEQQLLHTLRSKILEIDSAPSLCDWTTKETAVSFTPGSPSPAPPAASQPVGERISVLSRDRPMVDYSPDLVMQSITPDEHSKVAEEREVSASQASATSSQEAPKVDQQQQHLSDEEQRFAQVFREKLRSHPNASEKYHTEIAFLQNLSTSQLGLVFTIIGNSSGGEETDERTEAEEQFAATLSRFADFYLTDSLRFLDAMAFVRILILPAVMNREKPVVRASLQLILTLAKKIPKQIISAFLVPLLTGSSTFGSPQVDVILHLLRDVFSAAYISQFLKEVFLAYQHQLDCGAAIEWTDTAMELFTKTLPLLLSQSQQAQDTIWSDDELLELLLQQLNARAEMHSKSLKFCALLAAAVPLVAPSSGGEGNASKGGLASPMHAARFAKLLQDALSRTNTFLTKAAMAKLKVLM